MAPTHFMSGSTFAPPPPPKGKRDKGEDILERKKGIFIEKGIFFIFGPLKYDFQVFSQKISIFGFFTKKPRNTLVLRYLGVILGFGPPSPLSFSFFSKIFNFWIFHQKAPKYSSFEIFWGNFWFWAPQPPIFQVFPKFLVLSPRSPILYHTCTTKCGTCGTQFECTTICGT